MDERNRDAVPTLHRDVIHDVEYDHFGKRLATCSADHCIHVYDAKQDGSGWKITNSWKAHSGAVWRVCWANPEFGQLLASCSEDSSVVVWEEEESQGEEDGTTWQKKASLVDAKDAVQDVAFSPSHLGLRLATASRDGVLRVYEATDVMNLSLWNLMDEVPVERDGGLTCLSWNKSRFDPVMVCVGSSSGAVRILSYDDTYRQWLPIWEMRDHEGDVHSVSWAPSLGRSYHLVASGGKDSQVIIWKLGNSGMDAEDQEERARGMHVPQGVRGAAAASGSGAAAATAGGARRFFNEEEPSKLEDHASEVWKVVWNVTGTVLATSGDDGLVNLYKCGTNGTWLCQQRIDSKRKLDFQPPERSGAGAGAGVGVGVTGADRSGVETS